jgi:hypothetical protein
MPENPCSDEDFIQFFSQDGARTLADKLGIKEREIYRRRRRIENRYDIKILPPSAVGDGFKVKGTSTLYDADGEVKLEWVKTSVDQDRQDEIFHEALAAMSEKLPRVKPIISPKTSIPDLLNLYTITDYHLGMLSDDWDNVIAEDVLVGCFNEMITNSPRAGDAIICQLGDFLHTDFPGLRPETPFSGNTLDVDGRADGIISIAIRSLRKLIDAALVKHKTVHVIMAEGNHDVTSSIWLRHMFAALYEDEPRVTVDVSELPYYCRQHGETMLAFHHGHLKKFSTLTSVFAATFPEIWGKSKNRYAHCGHLHHSLVKEDMGMTVTQHRTLAGKDSYSNRRAYFSERKAECTTYHKKFGQVASNYVTPEMIMR